MKVTKADENSLMVGQYRLTTREVDLLIHDLAVARNELLPEVPLDVRNVEGNIVQQHDPDFQIALNGDRDILMGIRHRGLGWCVFTLSPDRAAMIRDFLAKRTVGVGTVDLVSAVPPEGSRPQ